MIALLTICILESPKQVLWLIATLVAIYLIKTTFKEQKYIIIKKLLPVAFNIKWTILYLLYQT